MAPQKPYDPIPYAAENGLSLGERKDLNSRWAGTTEPPAIVDFEAFETWTHQQIADALKGADTAGINSTATSWRGIYNTGKAALPDFAKKMQASIDENWQGLSGQAAAAAVKEYTAQADQLLVSMLMVASDLDRTESVILETQTRVGEPTLVMGPLPASTLAESTEKATEAEAEARRVMRTFYQPGVAEVDSRTPRLPEPQPVAAAPIDGGAGQSASAGGSTTGEGSAAGGSSAAGGGATGGGGASDTATRAASTTSQPAAGSGSTGAGMTSAGTGAAPPISAAGGATTAGLAGGAAGALAAAPRMGGPHASGSGGGSAAGVTPSASGTARNMAPMGGMYPPMGRGRGEDDQNREPNSYLVAASNASELVGDLPMTTQPVIGE